MPRLWRATLATSPFISLDQPLTVFICTVVRDLNGKIKGMCTNFKCELNIYLKYIKKGLQSFITQSYF